MMVQLYQQIKELKALMENKPEVINIDSQDDSTILPFINNVVLPTSISHKGQNGRVLVIGGSSLFHSASLWAAEVISHYVDIVHYASTVENGQIFLSLKSKFRNGIVVSKQDIPEYVKEDGGVLVGPGMLRGEIVESGKELDYSDILNLPEPMYTREIVQYLTHKFPKKRYVFDAGALQMMDVSWLLNLSEPAIVTPHQGEFKSLFGVDVSELSLPEKVDAVYQMAKKYKCVIMLKAVSDIISDGTRRIVVSGGNPGLTKGGSGDILAGLTVSWYVKNDPLVSCALASFILKKTADRLAITKACWYTMSDVADNISETSAKLFYH